MNPYAPDFLPFYAQAWIAYYAAKLRKEGFRVHLEGTSKDLGADLFATRKGERLYVQFKLLQTENTSSRRRRSLEKLKAAIDKKDPTAEFRMVFVPPLHRTHIEIEGLEEVIFQDIYNAETPSELDALSSHTRIEEVNDVEVDSVLFTRSTLEVSGTFLIGVSLQYGSDNEQDADLPETIDNFPSAFSVSLSHELEIISSSYSFDVSSFYE